LLAAPAVSPTGSAHPRLLLLGAAAVLAAYGAGYSRTSEAAEALAVRSSGRRRPPPPLPDDAAARRDGATEPSGMTSPSDVSENRAASGANTTGDVSAALPAIQESVDARASTSPPLPSRVDGSVAVAGMSSNAVAAGTAPMAAPAAPISPTATVTPAVAPAPAPLPAPAPAPTPAPAPAPAPTTTPADTAPRTGLKWKDGTFSGWGTSRHGDIEATVIIEKGRITAAAISRCLTRYSCSWIAHLQPQVVERQSPEVDNVSGATESANAFYYAVVEALKAAKP